MGYNLEAIMKVMRVAVQRSNTRINLTEILESYLIDGIYPMIHKKDKVDNLQFMKDSKAMIPLRVSAESYLP